ncbi:MAG: hypothetical protein IJB86_09630 [Clostridia bacterium]|nr:hypothetical protein [Clostridia bacterium]
MNNLKKIAHKKILYNKSQFYTVVFSITIIFSTLMTSLSMCVNYGAFFIKTAPQMLDTSVTDIFNDSIYTTKKLIDFSKDVHSQIKRLAAISDGSSSLKIKHIFGLVQVVSEEKTLKGEEVFNKMLSVVEEDKDKYASSPSVTNIVPPDELFSYKSGILLFPVSFLAVLIFSVFTAFISISATFTATKKDQLSFYATLMASGALCEHIKTCSFYESVYYLLYSLPFGTALSVVEILLIRIIAPHIFDIKIHASIVPSLLAFLLSCVIVFIAVRLTSSTAYKRLSPRTLAKGIKNNYSNNIGISSFSAEAKSYRILGAEHFIGTRCFSKNAFSYLIIIFTLILFVLFAALTFLLFSLISVFDTGADIPANILSFNQSTKFFVYSVCIINSVIILIDALTTSLSNINSNMSIYTLMRSGYSPTKSVCNAARTEGLTFSVFIFFFCFFLILVLTGFADFISSLSGSTILYLLLAAVLISIVFAVFILISVLIIKRRFKKLELISALKDYLY